MKTKETPKAINAQGAIADKDKGTIILLSRQQKMIYNLLLTGGHFGTIDFMQKLYIADPRRVIADLRKKGVKISDYWCTSAKNARYKKYYIKDTKR